MGSSFGQQKGKGGVVWKGYANEGKAIMFFGEKTR